MQTIRFLRAFSATERAALPSGDPPANAHGDSQQEQLTIHFEASEFAKDEEVQVQPVTIQDVRHLLVANDDQRAGVVLDDGIEGEDFERVS